LYPLANDKAALIGLYTILQTNKVAFESHGIRRDVSVHIMHSICNEQTT